MLMSNQFIDRYFERILQCNNSLTRDEAIFAIYADIRQRMSWYQNHALSIFLHGYVKRYFCPLVLGIKC